MAPVLDQSALQEAIRKSYGGSDSTALSFLRTQYITLNSLSKSRDLGLVDNLSATLTGVVGGHTGRSTLFFRIETRGISRIGIKKTVFNPIDDRNISVGVLDGDHNPMPLTEEGAAYFSAIHNSDHPQANDRLEPGVYYLTVSTNQWRETPFSVVAFSRRYLECRGAAWGAIVPTGRFSLASLSGAASGIDATRGTLLSPALAKNLTVIAGGTMTPFGALTIPSGVAIGRMEPYGRLLQNYRISGSAVGINANVATMTARKPYGFGY